VGEDRLARFGATRPDRLDARDSSSNALDQRPRFLQCAQLLHAATGPEAQQLAIYIGWLMHRTVAGVIAGTLFVLPGVS